MQTEPQPEALFTWNQIPYTQKRFNHTSTPYKHYIIMFGGMYESGTYTNDITVIDLKTNEILQPQLMVKSPTARYAHSACLLSENQIIIFGGQSSMGVLNETAILTIRIEGCKITISEAYQAHVLIAKVFAEWRVIETQGAKQFFRASHSAHIYNNKMYVFGGWDKTGQSSKELWTLDLGSYIWEKLNVNRDIAISGGLWDHCSLFYKDKILIFGGYCDSQGNRTNDFWILSPDTLEWDKVSSTGFVPQARQGTAMAEVYGKIYLFGGRTSEDFTCDLFSFDADTKTWKFEKTTGDVPSPRRYHTMTTFENKLIVIGGQYIAQDSCNIHSITVSEKQEMLPKTEMFKARAENLILKTLFNKKTFADVTFLVEDEQIQAHKSILSAGSKFFEHMFDSILLFGYVFLNLILKGGMQESTAGEIKIPDTKAAAFNALLQFLYCSEVELNEELALDLLEISNKYRIEDLAEGCEEFLAKRVTEENYVKFANISESLDLALLRKITVEFIEKNLYKVLKRDDVFKLPPNMYVMFMERSHQKSI